ncbi:hypothetical protein GCM10017687_60220 [Streptomyces echinatus]|uniref:peptidoglycan-binding domain-containing protein n=1 Tax=Streptomyces echinatus TaxID=67293 RepID=UPI0031EC576D
MGREDTDPERTPAPDPDIVRETRDSFQAVLDALDAARADLLRDERQEPAEGRPRSRDRHDHPTGTVRVHQPSPSPSQSPSPSPSPASSASGEVPPVERVPSGPRPEQPVPRRPAAEGSAGTGGPRPADTPEAVVAEPPGSPGRPRPDVPHTPAVRCGQLATAPPRGHAPSDRVPGRRTGHRKRRSTTGGRLRVAGVLGLGAAGAVLATWLLAHSEAGPPPSSPASGHREAPRPANPAPKNPSAPTTGRTDRPRPGASDPPLPEIPGTGVLRPGDSGHGVYELQVRLLQLPGIYDGGAMDGRYDVEVRAAVALFQERYGIRGDQRGVYGAETRLALMLRTK